jgi:hypothetical protein
MTKQEYDKLMFERSEIIRMNASLRMRGKTNQQTPVPPKPEIPLVPVAYSDNGKTYEGRLKDIDECPKGCIVKWEPEW